MKILFVTVGVCAFSVMSAVSAVVDGIQAIVHDSVITQYDVQEMTAAAVQGLRRDPTLSDEEKINRLALAERENLDILMKRKLILHDFKTSGYNLPESILEDLIAERIKAKYGDRRTMTKTLQGEGLTTERYRERLREQFIVEAMLNKNISSEIIISPQKVNSWYQANREQFKVEDEVKLRMIVVSKSPDANTPNPKRLAEELLTKVREGAPFTELAALYSQRSPRGDSGEWYERSQLRKELADAIANLKAGETSDVIETPDAFYLAYIEEDRPAHYKPLNEVRTTIENNLLLEERSRLEKQWVDRLKNKTFIRYF